jgi:hypothetical protein
MKFKSYQNKKIKNYFKNYSLLLISNGINQKSKNQILIKQELKKLKIIYYKIYNKLTIKIFKYSIYKNITKLIYSTIFFLTTKQKYFNLTITKYLETIKFSILGIKLNKKIYAITQLKNIKSTNYKSGLSVFYQFVLINLKLIQITNI